ncbi:P-loop containing nucleoside triphosphate hydrolase protein [Aaosphaeria arxii CBS 175.79]|uniref:P-loop containing nucleoside triphosphate hydrolase protein n=1 Tax=Aaosphaeria arxii CBS 175.79 TaxID=1450172 RepID=A0A6A5XXF5_9PLEO|nr:P-loop containing nucleoside triphosphate hydrolase protein [Aaosphaeria arxii CBS 175.79]KAF2017639.1 P-loop containing nucleoside triphosphate hydrolase protein [Aaosphaeria arxii CBS 175.79]
MASQGDAAKRTAGLQKLFGQVIHGHRDLKTVADGNRFLEALCSYEDAAKCVERLVAGPKGYDAIGAAFRFSGDCSFLNGPGSRAILYLSNPALKQLHSGGFLPRILKAILDPPTYWNTMIEAHHTGVLTADATQAFAWLLLELLCSHNDGLPDARSVAEQVSQSGSLVTAETPETRGFGHKIQHVLHSTSSNDLDGPGGRHDNDFADFKKIKILPTSDEFLSTEKPFYRTANAIDAEEPGSRPFVHLDNQFRLLREDFMGELRHDFHVATGQKKGRKKLVLSNSTLEGVNCGTESRPKACSLKFRCEADIPQLQAIEKIHLRKAHLSANKNILKHLSFGCLISEGKVLAFANIDRDEDQLAKNPPVLTLKIASSSSFDQILLTSRLKRDLHFVLVETAVFAFEPILRRLQNMETIPLHQQILGERMEVTESISSPLLDDIVRIIRESWENDLQDVLGTTKQVRLDAAQTESLLTGLLNQVSLIQGPPGTGKSFIGALIAKILHDRTDEILLVLTYTNHALDQFIDDLQRIGIPPNSIVRLGHRSSAGNKALSLSGQSSDYRRSRETYELLDNEKKAADSFRAAITNKMNGLNNAPIKRSEVLEFLEFSDDSEFFDAFTIPEENGEMTKVGKGGKRIDRLYLLERWLDGKGAGIFREQAEIDFPTVWNVDRRERPALWDKWVTDLVQDQASDLGHLMARYNKCCERIDQLYNSKDGDILSTKRIIAATTTGAAKYAEAIQKASPGVILVEEAGEILESHILTAMTIKTKQLILIGDHQQLRPKVNNYALTIEKGDGFNLNVSLFERLVVAGFPHTTLKQQHRMRPEISTLIRKLTYPDLKDASTTLGRPDLRGFQDNIMFLSHDHLELNAERIADRRDEGAKTSKENQYEAEMVLKCVRYIAQQGYGTDDIVVLTPYLGQLYLLMKLLSTDNDPVLNDLDSFELTRAGLLTSAAAGVQKRRLKISTIDNYQGEESDIVIVSLTRSNKNGGIGFMYSPQRVNVLLSRARNALIMIGNAETFVKSRKGQEVWVPLLDQLRKNGHVYDGFPVRCEQHPQKEAMITTKDEFDSLCPDGGCAEPCGVQLNCKMHTCPQRCHQLQDHSKMACRAVVVSHCPQKHKIKRRCHDIAALSCKTCDEEAKEKQRKIQRDFQLDEERKTKQLDYAIKLKKIKDEMEHQKRILQDEADEQDMQRTLAQEEKDLEEFKKRVSTRKAQNKAKATEEGTSHGKQHTTQTTNSQPNPTKSTDSTTASSSTSNKGSQKIDQKSPAQDDWDHQKKFEGAQSEALDALMAMIGLESVKQEFLAIKAKVDTVVRQQISLKDERFGASLLGNPGTGKTTVARLYVKFLFEVGALPGCHFLETSGSSLANDGVSACKSHIDTILKEGGGAFFIDEAYQLVAGHNPGGKSVLDYLLAEIENLTGKIVFVLAGYHKNMEAFFGHNPGIPSRIPKTFVFDDYDDKELQHILSHYLHKKYNGCMEVEDGMSGLYIRIAARRIGQGRGRDGFGNAREVQNKISQITDRQARRLHKERREGLRPNDNFLSKVDLIGPEPSSVLQNNKAWNRLKEMIGLKAVKEAIQVLLDGLQTNYHRELEEKPLVQYSLNKCFIGSPGTGKTTVAKLYGQILKDIGFLSNGEVVVKNPADFVGNVLGQSESNTKGILASTIGKVLIIDEAYMLAGGGTADIYKTAVIDTLVAEVQSTPGEDRCVLLLGYKDQMEEMLRDVNPGLARRFPLDSAFVFEDFTDSELRRVLDLKLKDTGFEATDQAKSTAMEVLKRARNQPNFGNVGEVDIILDRAKALHQKHLTGGMVSSKDTFDAIDFDPNFDRTARAAIDLPLLFRDVVGCEDLIKQLQGYQTTVANMKALGLDAREQIPFNFLFKGPPGTGKTTTAQKMGKVFYDMGFLAQAKVIECSATDMIGQYVGHTGPKVQKLLEKAMGKVLFIDEAYRLAEGGFANEAMDELVDCLTKPRFAQKLVTILAGYDEDMNRLMSINPGLTSRFPESVIFRALEPPTCLKLLINVLSDLRKRKQVPLDLGVLSPPSAQLSKKVIEHFRLLATSKSWGNARDVKSLAKSMFGSLISAPGELPTKLVLTEDIILTVMETMLKERSHRNEAAGTSRFPLMQRAQQPQQSNSQDRGNNQPDIKLDTSVSPGEPPTKKSEVVKELAEEQARPQPQSNDGRDPNVSDEVWHQLEDDKRLALEREKELQHLLHEKILEEKKIAELGRTEQAALEAEERRKLEEEKIRREVERQRREEEQKIAELKREEQAALEAEEKRKLEEEIIRREMERRRREEEQRIAELKRAEQAALEAEQRRKMEGEMMRREMERRRREKELLERERERKREMEVQEKLRMMGVCCQGFMWIKQSGGYRCAGGSHFMSNWALGL